MFFCLHKSNNDLDLDKFKIIIDYPRILNGIIWWLCIWGKFLEVVKVFGVKKMTHQRTKCR